MNSNYQQNTGINGGSNTPVSGQGLKRSENELLTNAAAQPVPREQRDGYQHSSTAALGRTLNTAGQSTQKNSISQKAKTPGDMYGTHNPGSTGASIGDKVKSVFAKGHGIGESLRGNATAAVDSLSGDKEAQLRDQDVARRGGREVLTGKFEGRRELDNRI